VSPTAPARAVTAQVEFESRSWKQYNAVYFQALSYRRFQLGFDRVNLNRPTVLAKPLVEHDRHLVGAGGDEHLILPLVGQIVAAQVEFESRS
jgi:hypothetical protein